MPFTPALTEGTARDSGTHSNNQLTYDAGVADRQAKDGATDIAGRQTVEDSEYRRATVARHCSCRSTKR
jgi:hypothetical protein